MHAQQDCVDTWSTDKIETFAPAAEQMIVVAPNYGTAFDNYRSTSAYVVTNNGSALRCPCVMS